MRYFLFVSPILLCSNFLGFSSSFFKYNRLKSNKLACEMKGQYQENKKLEREINNNKLARQYQLRFFDQQQPAEMCDIRGGFSILRSPVDLETIEEEPDDYLSQNSRTSRNGGGTRSLRNGQDGGIVGNSQQRQQQQGASSQTNTITTYTTQYSDGFDTGILTHLNVDTRRNEGPAGGTFGRRSGKHQRHVLLKDVRNALMGDGVSGGTTTTNTSGDTQQQATRKKPVDKWDSNYYYNNYGPQDPLGLYQWSNSNNYGDAMRRHVKERKEAERRQKRCCCSKLCHWLCCYLCCCRCCCCCRAKEDDKGAEESDIFAIAANL